MSNPEVAGGRLTPAHGRQETPEQRSDRNWNELLQELRVMQTGVQILTGFLLTLPFQPRFADLTEYQRDLYLVIVVLSTATTGLAIAPVSMHRALFRKHLKTQVVTAGDRITRAALLLLALVVTGVTALVFDVVVGHTAGIVMGAVALVVLLALWALLPLVVKKRS
jgi:L-cystine uptake protein TcyP (sodium:dicarboxylate symporter family)